jgi:hypothetical protein
LGWQVLGDEEHALRLAREAARVAGLRGFRYWSLIARSIVAVVATEPESTVARNEARDLAQELCRTVPVDLLPVFQESSRIRALLSPGEEE